MAGKHADGYGRRVVPFLRERQAGGRVPTSRVVRDAKLVAVPAAYTGRRIAGVGRRLRGRSRAEIDHDIRVRTAQHLFEVLGELRGCAAKLGQMAGIYAAVVPTCWAHVIGDDAAELAAAALSRLQDSVPPMLPGLVDRVLADNLGPNWRSHFRSFEERPAAAASLGQVHRAVWNDGRAVAVKVMYPGARAAVHADLRLLRGLSGIFKALLPGADVAAVIDMVCVCVGDELDYRREAANQQVFAEAFAGDPEFTVPAVLLSTDDVIVGEWVTGTPLTRLQTSDDHVERGRVGLLVLRFIATSHRRCGLLYSDIHPGNFLALPDGRLGVVDFGANGEFPEGFSPLLFDIADALYNGTHADLEGALRRHGFIDPGTDFDAAALARVAAPILDVLLHEDFHLSADWLRQQMRSVVAVRLSNVFRQMTLPPELTVVARAVITGVGTLSRLGAEGPIREVFTDWWPELARAVHRYETRMAAHSPAHPTPIEG